VSPTWIPASPSVPTAHVLLPLKGYLSTPVMNCSAACSGQFEKNTTEKQDLRMVLAGASNLKHTSADFSGPELSFMDVSASCWTATQELTNETKTVFILALLLLFFICFATPQFVVNNLMFPLPPFQKLGQTLFWGKSYYQLAGLNIVTYSGICGAHCNHC
jgi:hypothetical protein